MNHRLPLALLGIIGLLVLFHMLPLLALAGRSAGLPSWTYGELGVANLALARAWALMPAWLLLAVVALSLTLAVPAIRGRDERSNAP